MATQLLTKKKAERVGYLQVRRISKRRRSKYLFENLIGDILNPQYYKDLIVFVTESPMSTEKPGYQEKENGNQWGIKGKAKDNIKLEDNGKKVKVTGTLELREDFLRIRNKELGKFSRATIEFLNE